MFVAQAMSIFNIFTFVTDSSPGLIATVVINVINTARTASFWFFARIIVQSASIRIIGAKFATFTIGIRGAVGYYAPAHVVCIIR